MIQQNLEWVEGEWAENLETMQGTFGHRRVDRPDRQSIAAPAGNAADDSAAAAADDDDGSTEPESIHARSLMLSAPSEGLLAKLDLLEIDGLTATPVDYKRGQAQRIPEGAWEPERVQLCAQGLILRENGFTCTHGVLYYIGSKKRVTIEFTPELIARTRHLRDDFRAAAAAGVIKAIALPPPIASTPQLRFRPVRPAPSAWHETPGQRPCTGLTMPTITISESSGWGHRNRWWNWQKSAAP